MDNTTRTGRYALTDDEVETAATTYICDVERESPGTYGEAPEFADYHQVCATYEEWLERVRREARAEALSQAAEAILNNGLPHAWYISDLLDDWSANAKEGNKIDQRRPR